MVKEAFKQLAREMHRADPGASFALELWDGEVFGYGDEPEVVLRLKSPACAKRIMAGGFLGFGEAYMAGELEVAGELSELLRLGLGVDFDRRDLALGWKLKFIALYLWHRSTTGRAPKNIKHHYDLGDDFYALYLDESLTYSCAYFDREQCSLHQGQINKYDHIAKKLLLEPGESLLDIGCGWGGMLIHAAQEYGVNGVGITLSKNQLAGARERVARAGLADRVQILYRDYREFEGVFDKVVSIGMFEHVGQKYLKGFGRRLKGFLQPGGVGLLHTIGKETPAKADPWIDKYIFPGGYIPTLADTVEAMGRWGLSVLDVENLRLHYAQTLERWADNYEHNLPEVRARFDESFVRRWRLFLNVCAAAFRWGDLRLFQVLFTNGNNNTLPLTRDHLYR